MRIFLLVFLTIYGSINYYFFRMLNKAFVLRTPLKVAAALFLLLMVFSPLLVVTFERRGLYSLVKPAGHIAYSHLGFVFLFLCVSAVFAVAAYLWGKGTDTSRLNFCVSLGVSTLLCLYSFYEANHLTIERLDIPSSKLTKEVKIGYFSDLHQGFFVSNSFVAKVVDTFRQEQIDLLLCGGDFIELGADMEADGWGRWKTYSPPLGKYAVTGNHEFYRGYTKAKELLENAGFTMIENSGVAFEQLTVLGIHDDVYFQNLGFKRPTVANMRGTLPAGMFTILLKHRPGPMQDGGVDIQLSGHTHRGQLLPFRLITKIFNPYDAGLYSLANSMQLYVSRGTGTWGPRMRLLSPPEITIITVRPRKN